MENNSSSPEQMVKMKLKNRTHNGKNLKKAAEWVVNQESSSKKKSIKEFTKIDGNNRSYSINGIQANAQIRVEQDADPVLKNLKLTKFSQPLDDKLMTTNRLFKHNKANGDRISLKDGVFFRRF